jgi:hypothetical protein
MPPFFPPPRESKLIPPFPPPAPNSYGFTVEGLGRNPHRGVDFWVKVPPSLKDAEWKAGLLAQHDLTRNHTYDFVGTLRGGAWWSLA